VLAAVITNEDQSDGVRRLCMIGLGALLVCTSPPRAAGAFHASCT